MRLLILAGAALSLSGCAAIAALPVASQIAVWGGVATGAAAIGTLTVTAVHDCRLDGGCRWLPVP